MDIKIIVATHKPYRMPADDIYYPLHLGRENAKDFGLPGDNIGDNISSKNSYYNEMTGVYWAWKNADVDYIGLVHYRRYFANKDKRAKDPYDRIACREDIEKRLVTHDVILPEKRKYYFETIESHFLHLPYTYESDLRCVCQVIRELTPQYVSAMELVLNRQWAHMFNMFVMKREKFDSYCEWVFSILEEVDRRIDMTGRMPIEARFYISELLMDMWIETNHIKYAEMPVVFVEKENMIRKGWMLIKRMLGINYKEKKCMYNAMKNRKEHPKLRDKMDKAKYNYLIVGAGLFGTVFARQMTEAGKRCLVVDRREHIAGNIYSKEIEGIQIHMYGPHIFHTNSEKVWQYVQQFAKFNHFRYEPVANYKGELYNLPFNMNTFHQMWGINTPQQAETILEQQRREIAGEPQNLEEQAIKLIGRDVYEKLIKGYTQKQWGRPCDQLPSFIIRRLPVRLRFDNNYFDHPYQGIPIDGYTQMVKNMFTGIEVQLGVDYLADKAELDKLTEKVVYTGPIDAYFGYKYGPLEYRSLRFETVTLDCGNYQGVAGMNFTDAETPYTRIVEHKWFEFGKGNAGKTVITREYPKEWQPGDEPYYPVNDEKNQHLYEQYKALAAEEPGVLFGGRLAEYKYYDMDQVISAALAASEAELSDRKS